ncbi:MAG: HD family phosphohydrolase [Bacteroidales bacterium]
MRKKNNIIISIAAFAIAAVVIYLIFPHALKSNYEYQRGLPWRNKTLIAQYDFPVLKSSEEFHAEVEQKRANFSPIFLFDKEIKEAVVDSFKSVLEAENLSDGNIDDVSAVVDNLYNSGVYLEASLPYDSIESLTIIDGVVARDVKLLDLSSVTEVFETIAKHLDEIGSRNIDLNAIAGLITPNISFDSTLTSEADSHLIENISKTKGIKKNGEKIVAEGEIVNDELARIIESLKVYEHESRSLSGTSSRYYNLGIFLYIISVLTVLYIYLYMYRRDYIEDCKILLFIILSIVSIIALSRLLTFFDGVSLYVFPVAMVGLVMRTFLDSRTATTTLLVILLFISFYSSGGYDYLAINIVAGMIAIYGLKSLYKRAQLFRAAMWILISYLSMYFILVLIKEQFISLDAVYEARYFVINTILLMLTYIVVYMVEKVFGFVSDVTLSELVNHNHPLLRKMAEESPGTFQHSMQVANLAEAVIMRIGGNQFLAYAGALFHDVGKIKDPQYFTENQVAGINPHDDLSYEESAKRIIEHVRVGKSFARRYTLPEKISRFITTHHGTTKAGYFYAKQQSENGENIDSSVFTYPGPLPKTKEEGVIMLVDSIEATSRSLKEKNKETLKGAVEMVVKSKIEQGQLDVCDISFNDVKVLKEVVLEKLINIYHARIEYPKESEKKSNETEELK